MPALDPPPVVGVAASGGRDSTALLHATVRAARGSGVRVLALHVHHGLMPQADDWLQQVRQQATRWGAGFDAAHLGGQVPPGASVEAWARQGRYAALAQMAATHGCRHVLLAHHQRDQAETFVLQALRGGGAQALACMPQAVEREGITWLRPWLHQPAHAVEAYVRRYRLRCVVDPSNTDAAYARSRLRQRAWPVVLEQFPGLEAALAACAQRLALDASAFADATAWALVKVQEREQELEQEPGPIEAQGVVQVPAAPLHNPRSGGAQLPHGRQLNAPAWRALPPALRVAVLRAWLTAMGAQPVREAAVSAAAAWALGASSGQMDLGSGRLLVHRRVLAWQPTAHAAQPALPVARCPVMWLDLSHPGTVPVPQWGGGFDVQHVAQGGVAAHRLVHVALRARSGGEQWRASPAATDRSLKKQYQQLGVPAWERVGPLVMGAQGEVLFVSGLGMNAAFWDERGSQAAGSSGQGPLIRLRWWQQN